MGSSHRRHNDIAIERRFGVNATTCAVKQIYAVTYPNHDDRGLEQESYADAERAALVLAERSGVDVWYEETPNSEKRTLIRSFRCATTETIAAAVSSLPARGHLENEPDH